MKAKLPKQLQGNHAEISVGAVKQPTNEAVILPTSWEWKTISDLVGEDGIFIDGDWVESKDQDPNGDVRLVQLADVGDGVYRDKSIRFMTKAKAEELRCTFLKEGDVLIARMPDPLGRACIFPGDAKPSVTVVDVAIVRSGNGDFDHRWLSCFVNAHPFRAAIAGLQAGSTRKRISRGNLATIPLPVPPLSRQRSIAAEIEKQFTRLEAGVVALRRVQANLKRYRASVLKAACEGRLVPTEAELAHGEGCSYEPADQLLARTASRIPKDCLLAHSAEGWIQCAIGSILEVCIGSTPSRAHPEYWGGNIGWVSSGEVAFCKINSTREQITELGFENSSVKLHPPGTVLLAMIGEGKTRGQAALLEIVAANSQNSAALRPSPSLVPKYLYYFLCSRYEETRKTSSGNNQPALNKGRVQQIVLPIPPLAEQKRIVSEVERLLSVVDQLEAVVIANLQRATRLRQSILQKAFTGETK